MRQLSGGCRPPKYLTDVSFSAASACASLSPTEFPQRLRDRVCTEAASFSAASAYAPLSPREFPRRLRDGVCSEAASLSAASACAPLSPTEFPQRLRDRVCSEAASFSAASACAPLSPTEFPRRSRDRVCSEAASFSAASACAPHSPTEFRERLKDCVLVKYLGGLQPQNISRMGFRQIFGGSTPPKYVTDGVLSNIWGAYSPHIFHGWGSVKYLGGLKPPNISRNPIRQMFGGSTPPKYFTDGVPSNIWGLYTPKIFDGWGSVKYLGGPHPQNI